MKTLNAPKPRAVGVWVAQSRLPTSNPLPNGMGPGLHPFFRRFFPAMGTPRGKRGWRRGRRNRTRAVFGLDTQGPPPRPSPDRPPIFRPLPSTPRTHPCPSLVQGCTPSSLRHSFLRGHGACETWCAARRTRHVSVGHAV